MSMPSDEHDTAKKARTPRGFRSRIPEARKGPDGEQEALAATVDGNQRGRTSQESDRGPETNESSSDDATPRRNQTPDHYLDTDASRERLSFALVESTVNRLRGMSELERVPMYVIVQTALSLFIDAMEELNGFEYPPPNFDLRGGNWGKGKNPWAFYNDNFKTLQDAVAEKVQREAEAQSE